jgi:predicted transcriptional regulator YdeE
MSHKIEKGEKKFVIGIHIRTSNALIQTQAPLLWDRFYRENIGKKIPNKVSHDLLALYTEYEGDYRQPFTYLLGYEVADLLHIPSGMKGVEISPSAYTIFTAKGEFPASLAHAWQTVWSAPLNRSYTTDFEVYPPDFLPQNKTEISLYIATRK